MGVRSIAVAALASVLLAGCITTQEMPLAPNIVRLDTQAGGLLFVGQTTQQTMRKAAEATLVRGYTHFRLDGAEMGQGTEVAGYMTNANANISGNRFGNSFSARGTGFATTTAIRRPVARAAATVIMFKADEPGAQGAFDALMVLKQYGG